MPYRFRMAELHADGSSGAGGRGRAGQLHRRGRRARLHAVRGVAAGRGPRGRGGPAPLRPPPRRRHPHRGRQQAAARAVRIVAELDAALADVADGTAGSGPLRHLPDGRGRSGPARPGGARRAAIGTWWSPCVSRARPPWCGRSGPAPSTWPWSPRPRRTVPWMRSRPPLEVITLHQRDLVVAVGPGHPLARRRAVEVEELEGQVWVAGPARRRRVAGGVARAAGARGRPVRRAGLAHQAAARRRGPGADHRRPVPHQACCRTACGCCEVRGEPRETRRLSLVRLAGPGGARGGGVPGGPGPGTRSDPVVRPSRCRGGA